jgi:pilin isopeptide linkage protein
MNTGLRKRGRIAIAWLISITMVFASMSTPFAVAEDTPALDLHGITKVDSAQTQYIIPGENDFVFIKQATAVNGSYVVWSRDALTDAEKQQIIDYVIASGTAAEADATVALTNFFSGFGTFTVDPVNGGSYTYTFSENGDGDIVLDNPSNKISHIWYGQYDREYEISVTKAVTLNGDESTTGINGTVYVSLFSDAAYTTMVPGTTPQMITVTGGTATTATFTVGATGTYYVAETDSTGTPITAGGMMFGLHLVSIENSASDGVVVTAEGSDLVTITNNFEYHAEGSGTVEVNKVMTGPLDLEADMFDFTIVQTDSAWAPLAGGYTETVSNEANGTIPFSEIQYEEPGTYYYVISEVVPADPISGVTYDQHPVKVTMTVTDIGDGVLEGTPAYDGETTFTNVSDLNGSITVTKEVQVIGEDPEATVNYTFYTALFVDQEGTMVKVSDVKPLVVVDSASTSVTFDNLDLNQTYYVFETDADGNIIATNGAGKIVTPIIPAWTKISYENAVVTLTPNNLEGESTITNVFNTEGFPLYGSITVNKTVTVNGKAFASNRTFYVALFADKELTEIVSDVQSLKMNGNSSTTTEFLTDMDGNPLEAGTTYYIAETDKKGVPLTGTYEELGFEIDIDNATVVITEEGTNVNIINKFREEEFPLTGDSSDMGLWLFLAMLGVAGALAPFAFRKKEVAND